MDEEQNDDRLNGVGEQIVTIWRMRKETVFDWTVGEWMISDLGTRGGMVTDWVISEGMLNAWAIGKRSRPFPIEGYREEELYLVKRMCPFAYKTKMSQHEMSSPFAYVDHIKKNFRYIYHEEIFSIVAVVFALNLCIESQAICKIQLAIYWTQTFCLYDWHRDFRLLAHYSSFELLIERYDGNRGS